MNYDSFVNQELENFEAKDKVQLRHGLAILSEAINGLCEPESICLSADLFDTVIRYTGYTTTERFNGKVAMACIAVLDGFVKHKEGNLEIVRKAIQQGRYKEYEKQIVKNILAE